MNSRNSTTRQQSGHIYSLSLIVVLLTVAFFWHHWYSGRVVAEAHFRSGVMMPGSDLTCFIREYPQTIIPFASDGYIYGCEIRFRQVRL